MQKWSPLEDERGVDVGQIRCQLRMSVAERVATMVEAANVMMEIQRSVQESLQRQAQ